ncbi:glycoside hydrolase family 88 protein [Hymenobacter jejuensis]|uniref:Glucuronyl hydrolase n=1 Tax=Hymenobacter jejuensis TaxID=2502781 RepID=A0A5B8A629_9BACT|nr:glycoside hydrolase family 88 protein [Hymenobacter jejuensis]QDA61712.1 glucuronyl hydrolase [Hymenobacter jejuensis]
MIQTFKPALVLLLLLLSGEALFAQPTTSGVPVERVVALAEKQYLAYIQHYPDSTQHPRSTKEDGSILLTSSRNWTSGFFAGSLWYVARFTGQEAWRRRAAAWTETLEAEKNVTITHDLGFILYSSYGQGFQQTHNPKYRDVLLQASATLSRRFSPVVGAIRSWDFPQYSYPVIVDNLMNLEMLLWASKASGDSTFARIAKSHANTDLRYRFRKDNSSYHVLDFDPATGKLLRQMTHQGFADNSCWARGQGWAIYGYTMLYRETGNTKYLQAATRAANYFIKQTNKIADHIPYWDFNDNAIPQVPRDASAAAVAASGMLELSKYAKGGKKYYSAAVTMLTSLCSDTYLAAPGTNNYFLLKHSTGNKPSKSEVDAPLAYADYYFLEALWRYKSYSTLTLK